MIAIGRYLCGQVKDLTPLQGMDLGEIIFAPKNITKGMDVLRRMSRLRTINPMPHEEFWQKYDPGEFNK